MVNELWVEKYRPNTLDGYVFTDDEQKNIVTEWIEQKSIPHLLMTGTPGIGKTTLARILINELGILQSDVMEINASHHTGIDNLRDNVAKFVSSMSYGPLGLRIVLLDEADYLTHNSQAMLRNLIEQFSLTSRFILTANMEHKIIPALKSRCASFNITKPDLDEFNMRVATILVAENVVADIDTLDTYVRTTYPDLRKCINLIQNNTRNGMLVPPSESKGSANLELIDLVKNGRIRDARKLVLKKDVGDVNEIYRFLFKNLDKIFEKESQREEAILEIRTGIVNHTIVADPEINLAATLVKLARIVEGSCD